MVECLLGWTVQALLREVAALTTTNDLEANANQGVEDSLSLPTGLEVKVIRIYKGRCH